MDSSEKNKCALASPSSFCPLLPVSLSLQSKGTMKSTGGCADLLLVFEGCRYWSCARSVIRWSRGIEIVVTEWEVSGMLMGLFNPRLR